MRIVRNSLCDKHFRQIPVDVVAIEVRDDAVRARGGVRARESPLPVASGARPPQEGPRGPRVLVQIRPPPRLALLGQDRESAVRTAVRAAMRENIGAVTQSG